MGLAKKHPYSLLFLGIYFLWWVFVSYYSFCLPRRIPPACDYSPMAIVVISFLWGSSYALAFLLKSISAKEPAKTDYLVFLGISIFPLLLGFVYILY